MYAVCHLACNELSLCLVQTFACANVLPAIQRPKDIIVAQTKVKGTDRAASAENNVNMKYTETK